MTTFLFANIISSGIKIIVGEFSPAAAPDLQVQPRKHTPDMQRQLQQHEQQGCLPRAPTHMRLAHLVPACLPACLPA
jgi:hypothetical protein